MNNHVIASQFNQLFSTSVKNRLAYIIFLYQLIMKSLFTIITTNTIVSHKYSDQHAVKSFKNVMLCIFCNMNCIIFNKVLNENATVKTLLFSIANFAKNSLFHRECLWHVHNNLSLRIIRIVK